MTALGERALPAGDPAGIEASRIEDVLGTLRALLDADRKTNIGFPSTFDIDFAPVWPLFDYVLNNVGDPFASSAFPANTKHLEREVIGFFADLLRAPADDRWGYVTTGGTEGNEYGLLLGRSLYPDAVVYFSAAGHYSVPKLADKLRMPSIALWAGDSGELDLHDLRAALTAHRDRPAVVLATIGTTMTEAVDDVGTIIRVLDQIPIRRRHIHADAALSGLPLALLPPKEHPRFDLADGADSISISGHKFLGCPFPCGVVLTRESLGRRIGTSVDYIATTDSTLGGSRSGHAPLLLWYAIHRFGVEGLRQRAEQARVVAGYAVERLAQVGWPAWRHPYSFTVVMGAPPAPVAAKWRLPTSGTTSHLICMPGVTASQIDDFISDLERCVTLRAPS